MITTINSLSHLKITMDSFTAQIGSRVYYVYWEELGETQCCTSK